MRLPSGEVSRQPLACAPGSEHRSKRIRPLKTDCRVVIRLIPPRCSSPNATANALISGPKPPSGSYRRYRADLTGLATFERVQTLAVTR